MPQLTAATFWRIGSAAIACCASRVSTAILKATQAPEIAAVRVPPSAWMTSQSSVICRSPSFSRSTTARSERPISRWISCVRPDCLPDAASRRPRVWVARGSMPYSAVTQPRPLPRSQPGSEVSTDAVHSTRVSPNATRQLPSAWRVKPGSMTIARIWSGARPEGRMKYLLLCEAAALDTTYRAVQPEAGSNDESDDLRISGLGRLRGRGRRAGSVAGSAGRKRLVRGEELGQAALLLDRRAIGRGPLHLFAQGPLRPLRRLRPRHPRLPHRAGRLCAAREIARPRPRLCRARAALQPDRHRPGLWPGAVE